MIETMSSSRNRAGTLARAVGPAASAAAQPPSDVDWATLNAIDLAAGESLWKSTPGD